MSLVKSYRVITSFLGQLVQALNNLCITLKAYQSQKIPLNSIQNNTRNFNNVITKNRNLYQLNILLSSDSLQNLAIHSIVSTDLLSNIKIKKKKQSPYLYILSNVITKLKTF